MPESSTDVRPLLAEAARVSSPILIGTGIILSRLSADYKGGRWAAAGLIGLAGAIALAEND